MSIEFHVLVIKETASGLPIVLLPEAIPHVIEPQLLALSLAV